MTKETTRSLRDALLMDRLTSPAEFWELAEMAESLMLSQPLERLPLHEPAGEKAVIAKFGAHGLRLALEQVHSDAQITDCSYGIDAIDMIRRPDAFVDEVMPGAVEWAEQFGAALLAEAYHCLGKDAETQIAAYRSATTANEQIDVINWLEARLQKLTERPEEDEIMIYHPIRLSPKAIGRYPNIMLPPTCLGISIIAASFFHAAGAPLMHAGVMRTVNQDDINSVEILSRNTVITLENSITYSSEYIEATKDRATNLDIASVTSATEGGYHAVVLTRLMDGRWVQVDPNFSATLGVDIQHANARYTKAYDTLEEFAETAPNLELGVYSGIWTPVSFWHQMLSTEVTLSKESLDELAIMLVDDDEESLPRRIYEVIITMHKERVAHDFGENDEGAALFSTIEGHELFADPYGVPDYMNDTTEMGNQLFDLIDKYVLYQMDVAVFKQQCRRDTHFLERRIADIVAITASIPVLETYSLLIVPLRRYPHSMLEVGRPAPRIGFAVLSDIAKLMADNPLSPSFWHSVWPSLVPVTEYADAASTEIQRQVVATMAQYADQRTLSYLRDYAKIAELVSATTSEGGEENGSKAN